MSWIADASNALSRRPAGAPPVAFVGASTYMRQTYDTFSRQVADARDILFPPLARRPAAHAINVVFGTRIVHNSYVDIVLHAVLISAAMAVAASAAGIVFGLSTLAVEQLSLSGMIIYQTVTHDGLFRPFFN